MAYVVGNPRGIRRGRRVLRVGDAERTEREWREGDAIKPSDIGDAAFERYVERGLIVEKKGR